MCYDVRGMMAHAREMLQLGHIVVWEIHFRNSRDSQPAQPDVGGRVVLG